MVFRAISRQYWRWRKFNHPQEAAERIAGKLEQLKLSTRDALFALITAKRKASFESVIYHKHGFKIRLPQAARPEEAGIYDLDAAIMDAISIHPDFANVTSDSRSLAGARGIELRITVPSRGYRDKLALELSRQLQMKKPGRHTRSKGTRGAKV